MAYLLSSKTRLPALVGEDVIQPSSPQNSENFTSLKNDDGDFAYSENPDIRPLTPSEQLNAAIADLVDMLNNRVLARYLTDTNSNRLGAAPECIVTVESFARGYGAFAAKSIWSDHHGRLLDQITLVVNSVTFADLKFGASLIVHELIHSVQFHKGTVSEKTRDYHNAQYRDWMQSVGLQTSKTGLPGGADVGSGMSHYIIPDGPFDREMDKILGAGFELPWMADVGVLFGNGSNSEQEGNQNRSNAESQSKPQITDKSKTKFICPKCQQIARANYKAKLLCGMEECGATPMTAA